jgi:hypothetical protein
MEKHEAMRGTDIVRVEGRELVEHWAVFEQLGLLQQFGTVQTPGCMCTLSTNDPAIR